jgi:acyl-CoA reductase-like NAD-dependent aldehyde dehydrogenase
MTLDISGQTRVVSLPEAPRTWQLLIDGKWTEAADRRRFDRQSPAHGVLVGDYAQAGAADADAAIAAARRAFDHGPWSHLKGAERAAVLRRVGEAVRNRIEEFAVLEVLESGKPIVQARAEIAGAADLWDYAASLARTLHGDSYNTLGDDMLGLVLREPIGVVSIITPWNFPFLILSQKLPFALAAGCTTVVKPSELTPGTTLLLGQLLQEAGLPDGVVNILAGYGNPVGQRMIEHPDVDMVSFTGSTGVGKAVVRASAETLKKVSLELGGKNPQIVFADADLEAALDAVVFGVYFNAGECCNSGSRLLIQKSIAEDFTAAVIERARKVLVGDPLLETTRVGSIVNQAQFDKIRGYIDDASTAGAVVRLGGRRTGPGSGLFLEPTVIDRVSANMAIAQEEVFGPVLSVLTFDTPDEAVELANKTLFGLSAGVWTRDMDTAVQAARRIQAGTVWLNSFMDGYPELPFGGFKQSGLGRELGRFAVEDYTETKTLQMHLGPRTNWWLGKPAATTT